MRFDKEQARGRWRDILLMLGVPKEFLSKKHCPCPFCGGNDRYRFVDNKGDGFWICNQCGAGDGIELALRYLNIDFNEFKRRVQPIIGQAKKIETGEIPEWKRVKERRDIWNQATSIKDGDPVDIYLRKRIGLPVRSSELRTLLTGNGATMVARVLNGSGNRVATLHRTFLTGDGEKIGRKLTSGTVDGDSVAVRLVGDYSTTLGVAEGIETALSAWSLFAVPVWAVLNEGLMRKWRPPEQISKVIVFGDNDKSFVGQKAAYECAQNCIKSGKQAEVRIPETVGQDWNDVLKSTYGK